jgi:putative sterol carrier protein
LTFTGKESRQATAVIRDQTSPVLDGHVGTPDFRLMADSQTWLGFLAKERNLFWALLRRRIRFRGSIRWLVVFGKCFPA